MAKRSYDEIKQLVADNNKSGKLSNAFIVCLIWKETGFDDAAKNAKSSATGLMQLTKGAVTDVNDKLKPDPLFDHSQMTDAAKNIQCGTMYLDLRIKWAKDTTKGVEGFGTGKGYATSITKCEECMEAGKQHAQVCLDSIHK